MRNLKITAALAVAASLLVGAPNAGAAFEVEVFDGRVTAAPAPSPIPNPGVPADPANFAPAFTQAAGHPYDASTTFRLKRSGNAADGGQLRNVDVELPPGLIGNPAAMPQCLNTKRIPTILDLPPGGPYDPAKMCSVQSVVGTALVTFAYAGEPSEETMPTPVFNVEPPAGAAAAFAFDIQGGTATITARLEDDGDYNVSIHSKDTNTTLNVIGAEVSLWGNPADPSHDDLRCAGIFQVGVEFLPPSCSFFGTNPPATPYGPNAATYPERAFLTNPTACTAPGEGLETSIHAEAYTGAQADASFESHDPGGYFVQNKVPQSEWGAPHGPDGCEKVPFEPEIGFEPSSEEADSPTGLDVDLSVPSNDLEDFDEIAQSHLKKAVVALPEGMTVNPASADGLGACTPAQLAAETATSHAGAGCPESAKIGSVRVESPLLAVRDSEGEAQRSESGDVIAKPVDGSVYLAAQNNNPFNSLLALYIVAQSPERGIVLKLPGRVDPDPETGQLVATFDNNPQLPFSNLHLEFKSGSRAPLITPRECGTYAVESDLYPWARPDEPVHRTSTFEITRGPNGGPCPTPGQFDPAFEAGTQSPIAGDYSPLVVNASRPDGSEVLKGVSLKLPEGLLGKLAGVPACSEAALAAAAAKSGASELASSSCPVNSKLGTVDVAAGAGTTPFHVQGQVYLAGPHRGAPLSLAVVTPAVAGPFDLGTVVTRATAKVDPVTAQIEVTSDPIPTILEGIPLKVRSVSVDTNRPQFTINPTDCDPMSLDGVLLGTSSSKAVSNRFQVGACKALGFKPKLTLSLKGKVHRRAHPSLRATLVARKGDANIARAQVKLPKAAFLDNSHITGICTRVQFAAGACPKGSVYGHASATSPLLDYEVTGPVVLRANPAHKLPDLVVAFKGPDRQPIEVELAGKTDSVKGALRNTFEAVPDVPVTKFSLTLFGGKKGLVEMSSGFCKSPKATIKLDAQSGAVYDTRPAVKASGCKR